MGEISAGCAVAGAGVGPSLPGKGQEVARGGKGRLCRPRQESVGQVLRHQADLCCHPVQVRFMGLVRNTVIFV